jgi:glycosyltransferase involved in cell wall biosynthesis
MKVLHVIPSLSVHRGGPTSVSMGLAKGLIRKGVKISIFTTNSQIPQGEFMRMEKAEIRFFKRGNFSSIWPSYSPDLIRFLYQEASQFDIIHIHGVWSHSCFAAYNAARKTGRPYIITTHGTLDPWCFNYKALKKKIYTALILRRILNRATACQAITKEEVKHLRAIGVNSQIIVVPNGIDIKEFQNNLGKVILEEFYPQLKDKKVILFLGRIHPVKGLDLLAEAFARIVRKQINVILVIAGPDCEGYKNKIEAILKSKGALDKTIFTGLLTGKKKLVALNRADICVIPSYSEVRSIVALEAMICKVPIIITHQCHFPEVAEAKAGIIIEPEAKQLTQALLKLLDNPDLCREMGRNGSRLVKEHYSWDKIADKMIQLYENVLNSTE